MATTKSSDMLCDTPRGEDVHGSRDIRESLDHFSDNHHQAQAGDKSRTHRTDESPVSESLTLYTPPSSSTGSRNSDEMLPDNTPLLSDPPPQYQESAPIPIEWSQQNPKKVTSPGEMYPINYIEDEELDNHPRSRKWPKAVYIFLLAIFLICNVMMFRCVLRGDYSEKPLPDEVASESPFSRSIIVNEGHNPIRGRYPLYDLLSLSTTSGQISVSIDPQPADPSDPMKPARVVIRSQSGSVSVSFSSPLAASNPKFQTEIELEELDKGGNPNALNAFSEKFGTKNREPGEANSGLPFRPYELEIETASGSVSGRYIFSTFASIRTGSGSISAQLVPIVSVGSDALGGERSISLATTTSSGSTDLHLTEPYLINSTGAKDKSLPPKLHRDRPYSTDVSVTSSHTSTGSGSLRISYPQSWAGHVLASSAGHGSVWMGGHNLEVQKQGPQWAAGVKEPEQGPNDRNWWGGDGDMSVSVKGEGSGSIQFWVGR